jgi:hypothetical protein
MRVFSGQPQVPQHPAAIIREIHLVLAFPPDRSKVPGTFWGCFTQRRKDAKGDGKMRDCPCGFRGMD